MAILYKTIASELRKIIEQNIKQGIPKLPTEQQLCQKYQVSRQTIRQALLLLENDSLIYRQQGSGIYITGRLQNPNQNLIYILISDSQEYIYPKVLEDIHLVLSSHGFTDRVFQTNNRVSRETELLKSFLENPPRGLIVEGCRSALPNPNQALYEQLEQKGTFVIFLFNHYSNQTSSIYIKDDNKQGSTLLVSHLFEEGHKSIGGIFKSDDLQGIERYAGFINASLKLGLSVPDEQIGWFQSSDLDRLRKQRDTSFLKRILKEALVGCTAVVCYNDEIAYWLIKELQSAGYQLPEDMAVTAFDNTYLSNRGVMSITTLSHQKYQMGTLIAQAAIKKAKGLPVISQEIPFGINIKQSTLSN